MEDSIGVRIAQAREHQGLTVTALAKALDVRQQTIAAWEAGTATPPAEKLAMLARKVRVSIDYLLLGSGEPTSERERVDRLHRALDQIEAALHAHEHQTP